MRLHSKPTSKGRPFIMCGFSKFPIMHDLPGTRRRICSKMCDVQLMTFPLIFPIEENRDLSSAVVNGERDGAARTFVRQDTDELKRAYSHDRYVCSFIDVIVR